MADADTYRIIEIAGTSTEGVTEAMNSGVARAAKTLRGLDWVEVRSIRGHVEGDKIAHFQVEMRVGFKLEGSDRGAAMARPREEHVRLLRELQPPVDLVGLQRIHHGCRDPLRDASPRKCSVRRLASGVAVS